MQLGRPYVFNFNCLLKPLSLPDITPLSSFTHNRSIPASPELFVWCLFSPFPSLSHNTLICFPFPTLCSLSPCHSATGPGDQTLHKMGLGGSGGQQPPPAKCLVRAGAINYLPNGSADVEVIEWWAASPPWFVCTCSMRLERYVGHDVRHPHQEPATGGQNCVTRMRKAAQLLWAPGCWGR